MSEKSAPSTRFDGFTNAWEQRKPSHAVPAVRFIADDGSTFPAWEEKKLGDIADVFGGGTPSTENPEYWDGDVQWFTPTEVGHSKYVSKSVRSISHLGLEKSSAKLLPKGALLLTSRATVGDISIATNECCTNQGFQSLVVKEGIDNEFIYYAQPLIKRYCLQHAAGSTFIEISGKNLAKMPISISTLPEQHKIASFLSSVDETLDLCRRKFDLLRQAKKALMQQIFSQRLRFKADDGSEFPDWEEKKIGDIATFFNGRAFSQEELQNKGKYKVLRVGNLFSNAHYYYSDLELEENKYITNGDLIYAWSATFGPQIYEGEKCIYHYHIWKVEPSLSKVSRDYLYFLLQNDVSGLESTLNGGTMLHITKQTMESRLCMVPSLPEQKKIASCLSSADALIDQARAELEQWQEVKKSLLQQMFV